jgi:hypothetical protein
MEPEKTQEKGVICKISTWIWNTNDPQNMFQDNVHNI